MQTSRVASVVVAAMVATSAIGVIRADAPLLTVDSTYQVRFLDVIGGGYFGAMVSGSYIAFNGERVDPRYPEQNRIFVHDIATQETWDTGLKGRLQHFSYPYVIVVQNEEVLGDLNGNGRPYDLIDVAYDVRTRESFSFQINARFHIPSTYGGYVSYYHVESEEHVDYNGDGDMQDHLVFLQDLESRTESLVGVGWVPVILGEYMVWNCFEGIRSDVCYRDVKSGIQRTLDIPSLYPGSRPNPYDYAWDDDLFVFTMDDGADLNHDGETHSDWLVSVVPSTGRIEVQTDAGPVYTGALSLGNARVLSRHFYGYHVEPGVSADFIHDLQTGANIAIPEEPRMQYPQMYGNTIVSDVDFLGGGVPEGPMPDLHPWIIVYDVESGRSSKLGACCIVEDGMTIFDGHTVVLNGNEGKLGKDVNGDGDLEDSVVGYATTLLAGSAAFVGVVGWLFLAAAAYMLSLPRQPKRVARLK